MMRTLTPIFSILIAISLFLFFVSPMWDEIGDIRTDTKTYNEATLGYGEFNNKLNKYLDLKVQRSPMAIERLNQLVPQDINVAHILADIEKIADDNTMLFGDIQTDTTENDVRSVTRDNSDILQDLDITELQTSDITFGVIGTYDQLKSFLKDLETSLTLLEVTNLSFTASGGFFEQFTITVRTFALPN